MTLRLHDLYLNHPKLRGHPADYAKYGALALQRARHSCPVTTSIEHEGQNAVAQTEWPIQDMSVLGTADAHRVTEDGAEAVALAYVHFKSAWVVKRRLQRGESADWLLSNPTGWLAMEVSGTIADDPHSRLITKRKQISQCSLPAERLAVVVAFNAPLILAAAP
jgi:hypothetical protein